jgi:hypothetical protein
MKVSSTGSVSPAAKKKVSKSKASEGPGFASHLKNVENGSGDIAQVNELNGLNAVGSILAAQEVDSADDGQQKSRKKAQEYGENILNQLDEIKKDLLFGSIPKDRLASLAHSLRMKKGDIDDPALIKIIDDIELRASVELAKYTRKL